MAPAAPDRLKGLRLGAPSRRLRERAPPSRFLGAFITVIVVTGTEIIGHAIAAGTLRTQCQVKSTKPSKPQQPGDHDRFGGGRLAPPPPAGSPERQRHLFRCTPHHRMRAPVLEMENTPLAQLYMAHHRYLGRETAARPGPHAACTTDSTMPVRQTRIARSTGHGAASATTAIFPAALSGAQTRASGAVNTCNAELGAARRRCISLTGERDGGVPVASDHSQHRRTHPQQQTAYTSLYPVD